MEIFDTNYWGLFDPSGFLQEIQYCDAQIPDPFDEILDSLYNPEPITTSKEEASSVEHALEEQLLRISTNSHVEFSYSFDWCLKTGKKKSQQFWAYCEESQNNYARFTLNIPDMDITEHSAAMHREDGTITIVEDKRNPTPRVLALTDQPYIYTLDTPLHELTSINENDISFDVELVQDSQEPMHPQQGPADIVHCAVQLVKRSYHNKLASPLGFMFQINFRGRSEGWFKIHTSVRYKNVTIANIYSDTFMLNNPRMKKMKEHKEYSPQELKFMQIYSLTKASSFHSQDHWNRLLKSLHLPMHLCNKAPTLFPITRKNPLKRTSSKQQSQPPAKHQRLSIA